MKKTITILQGIIVASINCILSIGASIYHLFLEEYNWVYLVQAVLAIFFFVEFALYKKIQKKNKIVFLKSYIITGVLLMLLVSVVLFLMKKSVVLTIAPFIYLCPIVVIVPVLAIMRFKSIRTACVVLSALAMLCIYIQITGIVLSLG